MKKSKNRNIWYEVIAPSLLFLGVFVGFVGTVVSNVGNLSQILLYVSTTAMSVGFAIWVPIFLYD